MKFIELWQQRFYYWELLRVAPSESLDYLDRLFDAGRDRWLNYGGFNPPDGLRGCYDWTN